MSGKNDSDRKGQHMLADLFGVDEARLKDQTLFTGLLQEMASLLRTTPLGDPQISRTDAGLTGFLLLKDSHVSFHAYPDANYLAIDIFTNDIDLLEQCAERLSEIFAPQMIRKTTITRGLQS